MYMCQFQSFSSSHLPIPLGIHVFLLYVCVSVSTLQIRSPIPFLRGFPIGSDSKESPPAVQGSWVQSLGQDNPLEEGMATHSSILAWRMLQTRGAWGTSLWGHKELDKTEWLTLHTIFLASTYVCQYTIFVFLFLTDFTLYSIL